MRCELSHDFIHRRGVGGELELMGGAPAFYNYIKREHHAESNVLSVNANLY